jgi:hypothetical protein
MHIGVGLMVWSPIMHMCVGIDGHPFIPGGKKHEGSCCLCAKGRRVNCMLCRYSKYMVFYGKWDGK